MLEILLGIMFMVCIVFGMIELLAAFAVSIGWFIIVLLCLFGLVFPFFIFSAMFANFPIFTGILVIFLTIWVITFIIRKGFQGIVFFIDEIKRYLDERRYRKYK
ncbi:hypothetical protein [Fusobacterium sp.]|uniref:hypothetical protein n=1 Tax=Fusobacterium sp. TaxID=68766 RepID=UPI00260EC4C5|nr:hypothetical protein [Fusobacterium sp.]